ncbi:MAG: hypothetical protein O9315_17900 [Beijerinckiaceae bacterium]|nr:hypothetical protein [Brevundimonas sp.]MCZ8302114.1 hypothetical protein [Beijerinckiaceae bacterium]
MLGRSVFLSMMTLVLAVSSADAKSASSLPKALQGVWGADLEHCTVTGESYPYTIGPRFIAGYEHGWTIRRWTLQKGTWIGRGTSGDDQGSQPATVRLKLRADGKLEFDGSEFIRCPAKPSANG